MHHRCKAAARGTRMCESSRVPAIHDENISNDDTRADASSGDCGRRTCYEPSTHSTICVRASVIAGANQV